MRLLLACYALSGLFSLGYQTMWLRHFTDRFGSTTFTFVLVISCFIAGLGAGALRSRGVSRWLKRRLGDPSDFVVYGALEVLISLLVLLTFVESLLPIDLLGPFPYADDGGVFEPTLLHRLAKVPLAAVSILLPCFFMGVTFPLLCSVFGERPRFPSALYAWNTLGACSAVLLCEWVLLRYLGTTRTLTLLLGCNLLLGLAFVLRGDALLRRCRAGSRGVGSAREGPAAPGAASSDGTQAGSGTAWSVLLAGATISGFLSGALEADAFRRIHFIQIYNGAAMAYVSFWAILAIFVGSALVHALRGICLGTIKVVYTVGFLAYVFTTRKVLGPASDWIHAYIGALEIGGGWDPDGMLRILIAIFLVTGLAVFPTYLCVSVLLPFLCNEAQRQGRHLGLLYGLNTLAFLLGMVAFSWVAPRVNMFYAFKVLTITFAIWVAFTWTLGRQRGLRRVYLSAALGATAIGAAVASPEFDRSYFPEGTQWREAPVRALKGSSSWSTFVLQKPTGDAVFLDTGQMSDASRSARCYMKMMAHFPLLAQAKPKKALLICFGVGNTAAAIAHHEGLEQLDFVDLSRNIIETAPEFALTNDRVYEDPRVRLIHDDGRSYLDLSDERYDLITSEPPPPLMHGINRLYSKEYYDSVARHLSDDGCMTQWLPIYQMPPAAGELITRTFVQAFPYSLLITGWRTEFILVGALAPIDMGNIVRRYESEPLVLADLHEIAAPAPINMLARIVMTDAQLRERFGSGSVVSDQTNLLSTYWPTGRTVVFPLDPARVLAEMPADLLRDLPQLRDAFGDLRNVLRAVPDYPLESLAAAPPGTTGSGVDWATLLDLNTRGEAAIHSPGADEGHALLSRSLEILPGQLIPAINRAWAFVRSGQFDRAVPLFRQCVRDYPTFQDTRFGLATALKMAGEPELAIEEARAVLDLNRRNYGAHVLLGELMVQTGNRPGALRHFGKALEINPVAREARAGLRRLNAGG